MAIGCLALTFPVHKARSRPDPTPDLLDKTIRTNAPRLIVRLSGAVVGFLVRLSVFVEALPLTPLLVFPVDKPG